MKKAIFQSSPVAKYRVGGFPVLSLMGILALVFNLYIAWIFIAGPPLSFLNVSAYSSIAFIVGIFFACFAIYWIAWGVRKGQGVNLKLAFAEVPPE